MVDAINQNNSRPLMLDRFLQQVYAEPDAVFLTQPQQGIRRNITWREAHHEVARVATYLRKYPRGSHIAIYSLNCAHWLLADLAIWLAGHVSVPVYPTAGKEAIQQVLEHSDAVAVLVGKLYDYAEKADAIPAGMEQIAMHQPREGMLEWDEIVRRELPLLNPELPTADTLATIVYTSGTTGEAKGVMITFGIMRHAAVSLLEWVNIVTPQQLFSYLPLAHVAERLVIECVGLYSGSHIHFAESLDSFPRDLRAASPTIFLAVPRIWLKFQQGIEAKIPARTFDRLLSLPVVGRAFAMMIRRGLGLHRTRIAISGAAALSADLVRWYERLGIRICEGYGMTETFGFSHGSHPDRRRQGHVGECYSSADIKLADDGEILLRNPCLMTGYYKAPELTAQVIEDGWLHTGDLGEQSADGLLKLTGRKKEIFKTSKGKYVAPSPIEARLELLAGVEQLCVLGADMAQPVALAVLQQVAEEARAQIEARLQQALQQINASLDSHEQLARIIVVFEQWTTDNGLMTPTLKLRRHEIERRYAQLVASCQSLTAPVNWADRVTGVH
ncbi:AMP-binding protein [Permianibacter sp. IMCC34836]|uniref:AMP-binding protein n=1 Tax=Permianibacter fluminis TaxID=2738515 RepID=UPI001557754A|nr:AMP-binding protein [Permianibacter fluminis]NQD37812.1 AMP-binding protein [Permianibacter fluminis]